MSTPEIIGNLIKNKRNEMNISQGKLAKKLDVQPPVIYKYEKGIIKIIPIEKRRIISQILNIPIKDLLYENETPSYKEGYQLGKAFAYEVFATIFLTPSNISIEKIKEKLQDCLPNSSKYDYSKSIEYLLEVRKILLKNQTLDENDKKRIDECISLSLNSILPMSPDERPTTPPNK